MAAVSLPDEVASGDRRRALQALRGTLAEAIAVAKPAELAPLARQLVVVLEQLALIPDAGEATPLDDLTARRAARRNPGAKAQ